MKVQTVVAVTTLLMSSGLALAAEQSQEGMALHPGARAAVAGAPTMAMPEQMQKMQAEMEEIRRMKNPDKRDELIQAHMADMQKMMDQLVQSQAAIQETRKLRKRRRDR